MIICPITKKECPEDRCPLWMELDDFDGCPFDLANRSLKDLSENTLKPIARMADMFIQQLKGRLYPKK